MSWRRLTMVGMCVVIALVLMSCGGPSGGPIDVPDSVRQRARYDYPAFEILDAVGTTVTGASQPDLVEQDIRFTLKDKRRAFYTDAQYDWVFKEGSKPPVWTNTTEHFFRGTLDRRSDSFIDFFVSRYPRGDVLCQFVVRSETASGRERYVVNTFPRRSTPGCSVVHESEQNYLYDSETGVWAVE